MGILGGVAAPSRHPVEPIAVPTEQFLEGVPVTSDVGVQKFGVTTIRPAGHGADINHPGTGRHFTRAAGG